MVICLAGILVLWDQRLFPLFIPFIAITSYKFDYYVLLLRAPIIDLMPRQRWNSTVKEWAIKFLMLIRRLLLLCLLVSFVNILGPSTGLLFWYQKFLQWLMPVIILYMPQEIRCVINILYADCEYITTHSFRSSNWTDNIKSNWDVRTV